MKTPEKSTPKHPSKRPESSLTKRFRRKIGLAVLAACAGLYGYDALTDKPKLTKAVAERQIKEAQFDQIRSEVEDQANHYDAFIVYERTLNNILKHAQSEDVTALKDIGRSISWYPNGIKSLDEEKIRKVSSVPYNLLVEIDNRYNTQLKAVYIALDNLTTLSKLTDPANIQKVEDLKTQIKNLCEGKQTEKQFVIWKAQEGRDETNIELLLAKAKLEQEMSNQYGIKYLFSSDMEIDNTPREKILKQIHQFYKIKETITNNEEAQPSPLIEELKDKLKNINQLENTRLSNYLQGLEEDKPLFEQLTKLVRQVKAMPKVEDMDAATFDNFLRTEHAVHNLEKQIQDNLKAIISIKS